MIAQTPGGAETKPPGGKAEGLRKGNGTVRMTINGQDVWDLMRARHSVRSYINKPIEPEKARALQAEIDAICRESGLVFQLVLENPDIYKANKPHYGMFKGCRNCIVLYGPRGAEEKVGYFGERLVLFAQSLGLNTCWCALSFEKHKLPTRPPAGMILQDVIALGYGETQGVPHKSKPVIRLAPITPDTPQWFEAGMDAAMLAPTAMNQQRFYIEPVGERGVRAKALLAPCTKTDIGIVKYHFELGAKKENFEWVE